MFWLLAPGQNYIWDKTPVFTENVQGHVGWGFEQPGVVCGIPVPCQGSLNQMIFKVISNPNNFVILC